MSDHAASNVAQCSYTLLDNGIHELVFRQNTTGAVDAFMALLNGVFDGKTAQDPMLRIIVDASVVGLPPLGRLMTGAKNLVARHPDRPEVQYAFVLPQGSLQMITMLESFIRLFRPSNRTRSFPPAQRAAAVAWLLGTKPETAS